MPATKRFELRPDRKGAIWDLLLYVPTVVALASMGAKLWFGDDRALAYLLSFLASFFFFVGANRILKTRLMLLPSAPIRVDVGNDAVSIVQRGGASADLVKEQRVYADFSGRSFGISGLNRQGQRLQFVLHRGQFANDTAFAALQEAVKRLAKTEK
ncbi:MAG TPA: hypothetical protein VEE84_09135 [Burkholderiaceae bacterium]|nr:hypothetical protein [Burkholderiaceae bacterium]